MKKTGKNKGLTLVDVVNHITASKQQLSVQMQELSGRVGNLEGHMGNMEKRMGGMEHRMDRMEQRIEWIDVHVMNIEGRLNTVEIAIIQQKHEPRIRRVERHLKLAKV